MPMNYATLVASKNDPGSIKYFVRHSEVPSDYILERAQDAIYQVMRVREMVTRLEGVIAADAVSLALPADILDPIAIIRRGSAKGRIALLDQEHFEDRTGEEQSDLDSSTTVYPGTPTSCTYDKANLWFDAKADREYPYRLWYMQKPAYLASGNQTNFLTVRYGNILEAMCKHYAYEHREDGAKAASEIEKAMAYITKANEEYDMFRQSIQSEIYWRR